MYALFHKGRGKGQADIWLIVENTFKLSMCDTWKVGGQADILLIENAIKLSIWDIWKEVRSSRHLLYRKEYL